MVNNSIDMGGITRGEIRSASGDLKSEKAPGIDSITADLLKVDSTVQVLYELFNVKYGRKKVFQRTGSEGLSSSFPRKEI